MTHRVEAWWSAGPCRVIEVGLVPPAYDDAVEENGLERRQGAGVNVLGVVVRPEPSQLFGSRKALDHLLRRRRRRVNASPESEHRGD